MLLGALGPNFGSDLAHLQSFLLLRNAIKLTTVAPHQRFTADVTLSWSSRSVRLSPSFLVGTAPSAEMETMGVEGRGRALACRSAARVRRTTTPARFYTED